MTHARTTDGLPLVSLKHLTCTFGAAKALDDLNLTLTVGRTTAICGLSGSGKSSLLSILGLTRPKRHTGQVILRLPSTCSGQAYVADYAAINNGQETALRSQKFGFILQSSYLMPTLSARASVELPLLIQDTNAVQRQAAYDRLLMDVTSLSDLENDLAREDHKLPENLSGGQRQRFGILRALIHDPSVVFADEPSANLDPTNRLLVMDLLLAWKNGQLNPASRTAQRSLILVSHDVESVVKYADDIAVLSKGKLVGNRLLNRNQDFPSDGHAAADFLEGLINGTQELTGPSHPAAGQETSLSGAHEEDLAAAATNSKIRLGVKRALPMREAARIARSGLLCNAHHRWVTLFIVMTISLVCAAWFLTTGLLNGGELISEHRLKNRPLARRLLLGNEMTSLPTEHIHFLHQSLSANVVVDAVSPFRVLDWQFHVPANEADTTGKKGRTINITSAGAVQRPESGATEASAMPRNDNTFLSEEGTLHNQDLHPLLKGLGLAVDRRDQFTQKNGDQGIILCPRMMHRMFGDVPINESTVPKTVEFDLQDQRLKRNGRIELPVLGATANDPPELVYFLCPENYADQLLNDVVMHTVRIGPLSSRDSEKTDQSSSLTKAEWQAAVQQTWGMLQEEQGLTQDDDALTAVTDFRHNCLEIHLQSGDWVLSDWQAFRNRLLQHVQQPPGCLTDIDDATSSRQTQPAFSTAGCKGCYQMLGVFLDDIYAMPAAVEAVKHDTLLQGEVDRVIAELVVQLRSFSESKSIVLSSVKWILAIICFVCLLIIQILRAARKRSEAAMLRVIGFTRKDLLRLVLCDAAILWILGATLGLFIGAAAGRFTAARHYVDAIEQQLAFPFQTAELLNVFGLSFAIVLTSGAIAGFATWMRRSPADLFD